LSAIETALPRFMDFGAIDARLFWGAYADPHRITFHGHYGYHNVAVDDDFLTDLSSETEHVSSVKNPRR